MQKNACVFYLEYAGISPKMGCNFTLNAQAFYMECAGIFVAFIWCLGRPFEDASTPSV